MLRSGSARSDPDAEGLSAAVAQFGHDVWQRMRGDGWPEDRLRTPVGDLLKRLGALLGTKLVVHDEVPLAELRSRPDIAVDAPIGRVGYVELKAPGKRTPESWRPSRHDEEQWQRLRVLPNLVYTDGIEWALYRKGELVGSVARFDGDLARSGRSLRPDGIAFESLMRDFLCWRPASPRSLRGVISEVAPLCRLLRDQVADTLDLERGKVTQPFTRTALEWQSILFPSAVGETGEVRDTFADSYAQAVTFGLLLARVDGVVFDGRSPAGIAEQLTKQHSLMGEALTFLANGRLIQHLSVVDTLVHIIGVVDWTQLNSDDADTYAQLYETFLGDYDPALRRLSGTYYTPAPVARAMVDFVSNLLSSRLGKARGFAERDVIVLDPAMGAGTFLAEVLEHAVETMRQHRASDTIPAAHIRDLFENRLVGFEVQAAPFAVAELRLHAALRRRYHVDLPPDEPRYLTDALDDPAALALEYADLSLYAALQDSRAKASRIKRDVPVMVIIGNPPWRERAHGSAPWLEARRKPGVPADLRHRPSMDEFRVAGQGRHDHNLHNMWTYFWRWSVWKALESHDPPGIVALITPSAYLTSTAYAGMRRHLREVADEGWIIDLSPENHRSDARTRVFPATQHPICIGIFLRTGRRTDTKPARVRYTALGGTQAAKFAGLAALGPDGEQWQSCPSGWTDVLRPTNNTWTSMPALADLMPWQQPGLKSNRNWVHAPDVQTLERRWQRLVEGVPSEKPQLMKETRDRTLSSGLPRTGPFPARGTTNLMRESARGPAVARVAHRSFDRQFVIHDLRVVDYPRPPLWQTLGPSQVYLTEQHTYALSEGLPLYFSSLVPDMHCLIGHHGGRVLPTYRDAEAEVPNLSPGLTAIIAEQTGIVIGPEDFIAYVAGIVAHSGFTDRFKDDLRTPGLRVPLTTDPVMWDEAIRLGRRVIWLHTFGERMIDETDGRPPGIPRDLLPRYCTPVPAGDGDLPRAASYDAVTATLFIGAGTTPELVGSVTPVRPAVWDFTAGGMPVLRKWLSYRQPDPKHRRRTSPLDDINPNRWTVDFDDQLLELIAVLDQCVVLEEAQSALLDRVLEGALITTVELERRGVLPVQESWRRAPRP